MHGAIHADAVAVCTSADRIGQRQLLPERLRLNGAVSKLIDGASQSENRALQSIDPQAEIVEMLIEPRQLDVVAAGNCAHQFECDGGRTVVAVNRQHMGASGVIQWDEIELLLPGSLRPDAKIRPFYCWIQRGVRRDAVGARLPIREMHVAQIAVGQVAQSRMFKHVVAIPLDNCPVELLPPASRHRKSRCAALAQSCDGGGSLEITLQIPVGPQFGELFRH